MRRNANVGEWSEGAQARDPVLLQALSLLAAEAGRTILKRENRAARLKTDGSPVTGADEAAQAVILAGLEALLPGVPVIAEEQADGTDLDEGCPAFLLVDPLDGTREFIAGLGEYTVNIALVLNGTPRVGVVAAPALGLLWRGDAGGAERLRIEGAALGAPTPIRSRPLPSAPRALISRSHLDADTQSLLDRLPAFSPERCGSSLKFCRLAEGSGDFYPRLGPTRTWDIAAGHAVLAAAGGAMTDPDGLALHYGASTGARIVPGFLACGDPALLAQVIGPGGSPPPGGAR